MSAWFERDTFWEAVRPVLFSENRIMRAKEEVDAIVELLDLRSPARILDLACGIGRHSLELARRGYRVVGVGRTRAYIEEARERAREEGVSVEFVQADMRSFVRPASFEGTFLFFTSFGLLEKRDEDRSVLAHLHASLVPGGRVLLELVGKEIIARTYAPRRWFEENGTLLLEEVEILEGFEGTRTRWIVISPEGNRQTFTFTLRLYSARELRDMLEDVGFRDIAVYGSLARTPYDHTAQRMVAVARKPE